MENLISFSLYVFRALGRGDGMEWCQLLEGMEPYRLLEWAGAIQRAERSRMNC